MQKIKQEDQIKQKHDIKETNMKAKSDLMSTNELKLTIINNISILCYMILYLLFIFQRSLLQEVSIKPMIVLEPPKEQEQTRQENLLTENDFEIETLQVRKKAFKGSPYQIFQNLKSGNGLAIFSKSKQQQSKLLVVKRQIIKKKDDRFSFHSKSFETDARVTHMVNVQRRAIQVGAIDRFDALSERLRGNDQAHGRRQAVALSNRQPARHGRARRRRQDLFPRARLPRPLRRAVSQHRAHSAIHDVGHQRPEPERIH